MVSGIREQLTQMQNNTAAVTYENNKDNVGNASLGQDAFLQLLMTQLKYQDPTNPMNNQEFLAQQAQFTQLTELQELNENITKTNSQLLATNELTQASSMIGREVEALDPTDSSKKVKGVVSEVRFDEEGIKIVIGNEGESQVMVSSGSITSIKQATANNAAS